MVYKLTFTVKTPIITQTDIHLDALFSFFSPAAHNKDYHITRFTEAKQIKQLPLPIDAVKRGNTWIFCCSAANYNDAKLICENATKRHDGADAMYYHKPLTPRAGIDKDVMLKLYGVVCSSVSFLLSSSNRAAVDRYARRVKFIGSMSKQGFGEVTGYNLEEIGGSWEQCIIDGGKAIRNIPADLLQNETRSVDCCRTPYWLPDGKEPCAAVGEFALISPEAFLSEFKR